MLEGKARVLALTGAGVLSQISMTFLIVGLSFVKSTPPAPPPAVQAAAIAFSGAAPGTSGGPDSTSTHSYVAALGRSRPVHLSVPRVGIETSLMELGLQPDGTIEVPPDDSTSPAGWYRYLASPGEVGTAVIVGHLDSPQAPAVFFNLGAMRPGDHLSVTRADRTIANFTVTEVGSYPHDQFPTQAVYGPSPVPVLRLVTCGGPFQRGVGYDGNVVVFADMEQSPGLPTDAPAASPAPVATTAVPAAAPMVPPAAPDPILASTPEERRITSHRITHTSPTDGAATNGSTSDTPSTGTSPTRSPTRSSYLTRSSTDTSSTDPAPRRSEVVAPEPRRVSSPTRLPRRVRATPDPAYVAAVLRTSPFGVIRPDLVGRSPDATCGRVYGRPR